MKRIVFFVLIIFTQILFGKTFNLTAHHDSTTVLENPDKGWYHHFLDNGIKKYLIKQDSDLDNFPGMRQIYLRLAWSYLEPEEGEFNWTVIDTIIDKWTPRGYTIAFRITARETSIKWATPKWVYDLGAQGTFLENWGRETFEPDYDDPIFLEKLEQFHTVFAQRYDGQPWIDWIEVGSYGDWGEGHTSSGSKYAWPNEALKKHIDIYAEHYTKSPLACSEDFLHHRDEAESAELRAYIEEREFAWRDDSILVGWYVDTRPETYSVAMPEVFQETWQDRPVIIELGHYHNVIEQGNWQGQDGSIRGADIFRGACDIMHPTWIGYHGYADTWLAENPNLAKELANKVGYWYFPLSITIPDSVTPGQSASAEMVMQNKGYAPAYERYNFIFTFEGEEQSYSQIMTAIDNRDWLPGTSTENFEINFPHHLAAGEYTVKIKMEKPGYPETATIFMGLDSTLLDENGFYTIGTVYVNNAAANHSPEIQLNIQPNEGDAPLNVNFDASGSTDVDADELTFEWHFGDGAIAGGASVLHTFNAPNSFQTILNVTDGRGGLTQSIQQVDVSYTPPPINQQPQLELFVDKQSGDIPLTVHFDASSSIDPDGDALSFFWDFGDGHTATGATVDHTYDYVGEYTASVVVDDGHDIYNDRKKEFEIMAGTAVSLTGKLIGSENPKKAIENAFDGDPATFFEGADKDSSWVGIDLDGGKGKTAHVVKVAFIPRENRESRMIKGVFQGANQADFSDAVDLYVVQDKPQEYVYTFAVLNNTQPFRYLRYIGPSRSYGTIAEIEFYGSYLTDVENRQAQAATTFVLEQNYPNPFNPVTRINYQLAQKSNVKLKVFDLQSRLVATLVDESKAAGHYTAEFDGRQCASGIYFYQLIAGDFESVKRMTLLK